VCERVVQRSQRDEHRHLVPPSYVCMCVCAWVGVCMCACVQVCIFVRVCAFSWQVFTALFSLPPPSAPTPTPSPHAQLGRPHGNSLAYSLSNSVFHDFQEHSRRKKMLHAFVHTPTNAHSPPFCMHTRVFVGCCWLRGHGAVWQNNPRLQTVMRDQILAHPYLHIHRCFTHPSSSTQTHTHTLTRKPRCSKRQCGTGPGRPQL